MFIMADTDRAVPDAVRNHHRRYSVGLRILRTMAVGRDLPCVNLWFGEAQDGRVDEWLGSRIASHSVVLYLVVCRVCIF